MGRRPISIGPKIRICTSREGRHLASLSPVGPTATPSTLRRIDAASSRAVFGASTDILVLNAVVLHPRRAQLDGQPVACSIDGRAFAPCRRSWIHGGLLQCCRQRGFRRHLRPRVKRTDTIPQRTRHYGWIAARSVMFVCMTTTAVHVDHRGAQLSCNGFASLHFACTL